jgi:cold-inducible RNA-binding protein
VGVKQGFASPPPILAAQSGGRVLEPSIESRAFMANRLYVGNLPFSANSDTLRDAFSAHGEVTDAHVMSDRETGQSRGFGFVTMGSADAARQAIREMNGFMLDGRAIKVSEAEERPNRGPGGGGGGGGGGGRGGRGGPRR